MDEFIRQMLEDFGIDPNEVEVIDLSSPEDMQALMGDMIATEAWNTMYPMVPTNRPCTDPMCDCGGTGRMVVPSALN